MTATSETPDILEWPLGGMSLVEASAGTGKTWNICVLFLRLLLEKEMMVSEILVVTFTNAATAELKERIRARMMEMLRFLENTVATGDEDPFLPVFVAHLEAKGMDRGKMALLLRAALSAFDEAMISTIHGFCQKVANSLAFGTKQPFSFTVERDEKETLIQVVHDFWRRHVASDTLDRALAMYLNAKKITPEGLATFLKRAMDKPLAEKRWPNDMGPMDAGALDALVTAWGRLEKSWQENRETLYTLIDEAVLARNLSGTKYGKRPLPNIFADAEWLFQQNDPVAFSLSLDPKDRPRIWRLTSSGLDDGKNGDKTPPAHPFFDLAEEWMALRNDVIRRLEGAYLHLLSLLEKEADEVRNRRRKNRVLSSDDMLYRLYDILYTERTSDSQSGLAASICRLYPAALVDEFQDTDPVQFFIFQAIYAASDAPVFFVGDPKQAIYRFRNADLHTYLAAKEVVRKKEGDKALHSLTKNQRSTPEVIDACNTLFLANPDAFMLEGLDYPPVSPGERQRDALSDETGSGITSGMVLWRLPETEDGDWLKRADAINASADAVAGEIARLLLAGQDGLIHIGDAPLKASDMAVLVRSHREARIMQAALSAHGLASVSLSPGSVWNTFEAQELVTVLSAITTPRHQSRLRAALATEMMGFDAAQIESLAIEEEKQLEWVEHFMAYQAGWLEHGISFVLRQIMATHDVYARMLALPDGERRLTNILHLAELLNEAAQTHPLPESLLRWMYRQQENGQSDENTQMRLESDEKLIRITTVHAAKGLEYPFVFFPFLWDAYPSRKNSLPGKEYQEGQNLIMDFRRLEPDEENDIKSRMDLEDAADQLRLVYVALTRAIYRAYVVAGCYATLRHSTSGTLNWLAAGKGIAPKDWLSDGSEKRAGLVNDAWYALPQKCKSIVLENLPMTGGETPLLPEDTSTAPLLTTAAMPRHIPAGWRIGSYSALVYGAVHETSGSDHDERIQDAASTDEPIAELREDDILLFPTRRYAGNCLHAVFEEVDFTDEGTWDAAIDRALDRHPPYGRSRPEDGIAPEKLKLMIRQMLRNVFDTPLHDGIMLKNIGGDKRLTELEFFLPASHLSAAALNGLLSSHYPVSRLFFRELGGYLKGLIDLVFEHEGRFYILDWKSNFLGNRQANYGKKALDAAMAEHDYHLQHLIYTVALNRYLATCLPDYAYEQHFGGVLYLFVRGVRPGWQTEEGNPDGVFFHRADESLIRRLDALIGEGGER